MNEDNQDNKDQQAWENAQQLKKSFVEAKDKYFTPQEQKTRIFEKQLNCFSSDSIKPKSIKKFMEDLLPGVQIDDTGKIILRSIGKVFIQQLIEEAREIGYNGENKEKITVQNVRDAYRNMRRDNKTLHNQPLKKILE